MIDDLLSLIETEFKRARHQADHATTEMDKHLTDAKNEAACGASALTAELGKGQGQRMETLLTILLASIAVGLIYIFVQMLRGKP